MASEFNTVDLFYKHARQTPEKTALIYRNKTVTFADLAKSIDRTAAYFLKKGITRGDRVMVFVPMSDDLYRIVLALFRIGAIAVFLDEWVSVKRLNACCELADCKAFIGTPKGRLLAWFVPGLRRIPLHLGLQNNFDGPHPEFPLTYADDIALITFTTGSTGTPKAAIRTHGLLHAQFQALIPLIKPREQDVSMPVLPIILLLNLGAGVTSVIADYKASKPDSLNPEKILAQLRKYHVNTLIASPFFVKKIAECLIEKKQTFHQISNIFTGGAPVFPAEARKYIQAFPAADIRLVYGSTEAEPISSISAAQLIAAYGEPLFEGLNVGKPEDGVRVKMIEITNEMISVSSDKELEDLEVRKGETGEIIVSGKHVLQAYLNNPEAQQRNKIRIGNECWHRTGDSGYLDAHNDLHLTGRCNALLEIGGKIVSPFVYENYFQTIEGVEMGTIIKSNNKLHAILEVRGSAKKEQIEAAVRAKSAAIENIIFIHKIPRDPRHNSKIDYERLGERLFK